jgi:opacity protein-like surface antigen
MFQLQLPLRISVLALLCLWVWIEPVSAEWYTGAYGGLSTSGSIKDVTMPLLGQRLAEQQFPQANDPLDANGRGTLTQTFKTSDISLKNAAIFGGKIGYFFTEEKLPWLGVELEAFTTNPAIKAQQLTTEHDITYQPNTPAPAANCQPPIPQPNCPAFVRNNSTLSLEESSLRVSTLAFNLIARYPGTAFQPYVGIGGGAFYFSSSNGSVQGRQVYPGLNALAGARYLVTEEWGIFAEGKYNMANVTNFDPAFGLSGMYSIFHLVAGVSFHF